MLAPAPAPETASAPIAPLADRIGRPHAKLALAVAFPAMPKQIRRDARFAFHIRLRGRVGAPKGWILVKLGKSVRCHTRISHTGTALCRLAGFGPGRHAVRVFFRGSADYAPFVRTVRFTVKR